MRRPVVQENNCYGEEFLSYQKLGERVKRNTVTMYAVAGIVSIVAVQNMLPQKEDTHMLLESEAGRPITIYEHTLQQRTAEERMQIAVLLYKGLRQRTGIKEVDGKALEDWRGQVTRNAMSAWGELGERWRSPNIVKTGFRRTVSIVSVSPDKANPYAFGITAIESEGDTESPRKDKSFHVRLTLFFTDPSNGGTSKLDGIILHSEEPAK